MQRAIGGFFELELLPSKPHPHAQALHFHSARVAFLALLQATKPKKVWMPRYICDSMLAPLAAAGVAHDWYGLTEDLDIAREIDFRPDDLILYVNYFGVCDRHIDAILNDFGRDRAILDFSQALFSPPIECLATIYSARKFLGVPDGAFLHSGIPVQQPDTRPDLDALSLSHLLGRLADGPERHYAQFARYEEHFDDIRIQGMSELSSRILYATDWEAAGLRRLRNFALLHSALGETNAFNLKQLPEYAPLCYPYMTSHPGLRRALTENRIYAATYWKDVEPRSAPGTVESRLVEQLIPIPCDQRYGPDEMRFIVSIIKSHQ